MSAFLKKKKAQIKKGVGELVEHVLGFTPDDDNYHVAVRWANENIDDFNFRKLDTSKPEVQASIEGIQEKLTLTNQGHKAKALAELFEAFEQSMPDIFNVDSYYSIIRMLVELSSTRARRSPLLSRESPMKFQARKPRVDKLTAADIGVDEEVVQLINEWEEDYKRSLVEEVVVYSSDEEPLGISITEDDIEVTGAVTSAEPDSPSLDRSALLTALSTILHEERRKRQFVADDEGEHKQDESDEHPHTISAVATATETLDASYTKSWNRLATLLAKRAKANPQGFAGLSLGRGALVTETHVVKQLLLLLRTVQGPLFRFNAHAQQFTQVGRVCLSHVSPSLLSTLMDGYVAMAEQKRLLGQFATSNGAHGSGMPRCLQAFCGSLQSCLLESARNTASFEATVRDRDNPAPATLLALHRNTAAHVRRIKFLTQLLSRLYIDGRPSVAELLSVLYDSFIEVSLEGARPDHCRMVFRLLLDTLQPYLQMLDKWMSDGGGTIEDPCGEFMIQEFDKVDLKSAEYWTQAFRLRRQGSVLDEGDDIMPGPRTKLSKQDSLGVVTGAGAADEENISENHTLETPRFLLDVAHKILLTGKSINLIKQLRLARKTSGTPRKVRVKNPRSAQGAARLENDFWKSLRQLHVNANPCSSSPPRPSSVAFSHQPSSPSSPAPLTAMEMSQLLSPGPRDLPPSVSLATPSTFVPSSPPASFFDPSAHGPPRSSMPALQPLGPLAPSYPREDGDRPAPSISDSSGAGHVWEGDLARLVKSMHTDLLCDSASSSPTSPPTSPPRLAPLPASTGALNSSADLLDMFSSGIAHIPTPHALLPCLTSHIYRRYGKASRQLKTVLLQDCRLLEHLKALREFFFLVDGEVARDQAVALFQRLDDWDEDNMTLNQTLKDWLRCSPLCDSELADCLSIAVDPKLLKGANKIEALAAIQFTHNVPWPMNAIVTQGSVVMYNDIFVFLLQILRAKLCLESMTTSSQQARSQYSSVAHNFFLLKREVHHFLSHMHHYVMLKVVDGEWLSFKASVKHSLTADLDELRELHDTYLQNVQRQTLLFKRSAAVGAIRKVLSLCLDLKRVHQSSVFDLIEQSSESLSQTLEKVALQRLAAIREEFTQLVRFLLKVLTKIVEKNHHPHFEHVLSRLNFNNFYKLI